MNIFRFIIVGSNGLFLSTNDQGTTWLKHDVGTNETLRNVYIVNDNLGFIVGSNGTIIKFNIEI